MKNVISPLMLAVAVHLHESPTRCSKIVNEARDTCLLQMTCHACCNNGKLCVTLQPTNCTHLMLQSVNMKKVHFLLNKDPMLSHFLHLTLHCKDCKMLGKMSLCQLRLNSVTLCCHAVCLKLSFAWKLCCSFLI